MAEMTNEQKELNRLSERMKSLKITNYEVRERVMYVQGVDIGGIAYLISRSDDQLKAILKLMGVQENKA